MSLYDTLLNNKKYLNTVNKIEKIKFITNGKWDWEHGLEHYKRVAAYIKDILTQLKANERTIDLAMACALVHDIGLSKGQKVDHAIESSKIFMNFIDPNSVTQDEIIMLKEAIIDHSNGNDIKSLIGLSLVLADKLDVTYHRTINSSIQDEINKEIQKIKEVKINITEKELIIHYLTDISFDINILKEWKKAITIPYKVSKYLNKIYIFKVNNKQVDFINFIN